LINFHPVVEKTGDVPLRPHGIDLFDQHGDFQAESPGTVYGDWLIIHRFHRNRSSTDFTDYTD
jgi:hypothetical protein